MKNFMQEAAHTMRQELHLQYPIFAITRVNDSGTKTSSPKGCVYQLFDAAAESGVVIDGKTVSCRGACVGCGFQDGMRSFRAIAIEPYQAQTKSELIVCWCR